MFTRQRKRNYMDRSIVLCDHDLLWDTRLKKELADEDIFIGHADSIEDIGMAGNIFPSATAGVIVCSVEEFYNFIECKSRLDMHHAEGKILAIADNYSASDELAALSLGCFDYQLRTVPVQIIAQRIRNRIADISPGRKIYYNKDTKDIYKDGCLIKLTRRERGVLDILLCNKGMPVAKEIILKEVWGKGFNGSIRVIDTVIKQLRHKLKGYNVQIITYYGRGISIEIQ